MAEREGLLIAIEGSDGTGKETQKNLLRERLVRDGHTVSEWSFPTYGRDEFADRIRHLMRAEPATWKRTPWEQKALLFAMNRLTFRGDLYRELSARTVVLCDRYVASNQAHMAAIETQEDMWGRRFQWIETFEYDLLQLPRPDIVILLTVPTAIAQRRLRIREGGNLDAHESDATYLERVTGCYERLAAHESEVWRVVPMNDGAGSFPLTRKQTHERVWRVVQHHPAWQRFVSSTEAS